MPQAPQSPQLAPKEEHQSLVQPVHALPRAKTVKIWRGSVPVFRNATATVDPYL